MKARELYLFVGGNARAVAVGLSGGGPTVGGNREAKYSLLIDQGGMLPYVEGAQGE